MLLYSLLIASFVPAIFAHPYNVKCDGMTKDKTATGGPASQMWTTATTIMGNPVVDDNNVITADKTTVAVGEKVTITAATDGGRKLIYNKDGTSVGIGNLFQRTTDYLDTECAGKAVYEVSAAANPKAQWTAPDTPGTYTIWVGYAAGYSAVTRGKVEITVTAADDTPTQTSGDTMDSMSSMDSSADDASSMAPMSSMDSSAADASSADDASSPGVSDDSSANTAMFTAAFVITAITFLLK